HTTEGDHLIEVWGSGKNNVPAYQGTDFVELNANAVGTLYQDVMGIATGNSVSYSFAHRGRLGTDTMRLDITDQRTHLSLFSQQYSDGNGAWGLHSGSFSVGSNVLSTDAIRFAYVSISAFGGNPSVGNFLDDAHFGVGPGFATGVPEPSTCTMALLGTVGMVAYGL